jgi:hypothetical protein
VTATISPRAMKLNSLYTYRDPEGHRGRSVATSRSATSRPRHCRARSRSAGRPEVCVSS